MKYFLVMPILLISSQIASAQGIVTPTTTVGMGAYIRGGVYAANKIARMSEPPRPTVPALIGSLVTKPVTVQGKGAATVVNNNAIVNTRNATGSAVKVKCPSVGHRVILRNNKVINQGRITSSPNGNAGAIVVECGSRGANIDISGNTVTGSGSISAR